MKTFRKMLKIESKLSIRDMNMIVFALIMPAIILVVIGVIYGTKPAFEGADYTFLEQSFGALSSIAICASGLMGLPIMISEYRERKILKRFQVTPISPALLLVVHFTIYTLYSILSAVLLWIVAKIFWGVTMKGSVLLFAGGFVLVLISMLSIGVLVGGVAKNSKQASIIASVLYFPMLVFSGATLPYEVMPKTMQKVVDVMPLTQGIKILKAATTGEPLNQMLLPVVVMLLIAVVCISISIKVFRWE